MLTGPAAELVQGCCSYGAHFTDDDDVARVKAAAKTLTDEEWQFAAAGRRGGVVRTKADGTAGHPAWSRGRASSSTGPASRAGPGCALHRAALGRGQRPLELKPDVCWQLPLRREDTTDDAGRVTSTVTQWDRRHWGDGGEEFHWWCTEAPEAFAGRQPVYETMAAELIAMVGDARLRAAGRLSAGPALDRDAAPPPAVRQRPRSPGSPGRPLGAAASGLGPSPPQARCGSGSEYSSSSSSSSSIARHHDA